MRLSANFNPTNSLNIKPSDAQNLSVIQADIRKLWTWALFPRYVRCLLVPATKTCLLLALGLHIQ